MKEISREPDHAASGLHQEQEGLKKKSDIAGWSKSDKNKSAEADLRVEA